MISCTPIRNYTFEEVIFFNDSVVPFRTSSDYIKVCLNVSNHVRSDDSFYELTGMTKGVLEKDEFLFYINSYTDYPNLGVIARNSDCFFSELIYYTKNFSFEYVNESIEGSVIIKHYSNYVSFIQDKYDSSLMPNNSLKSIYVTAPIMERELNTATLSLIEPINKLHPVNIKIRGGYGRASPKKSYSVHFLEETNIHGVQGKVLYLQSQFNDPNLNRNAVSLSLFEALGYVVPEIEFVNVFMNERYIGVYELTNRIDKGLLDMNFDLNDPTRLYKVNFYGNNCELAKPVQTEKSLCDENFSLEINQAIDYYLLTKITGAIDNIGKNYFISVDKLEKAYIWPWDLDYTFFKGNTQQKLVGYTENEFLYPVISNDVDRVVDRYYELRASHWSNDNLIDMVNETIPLDNTLNYNIYVFPEKLPKLNLTNIILERVIFLDNDFRSIVLNDLAD